MAIDGPSLAVGNGILNIQHATSCLVRYLLRDNVFESIRNAIIVGTFDLTTTAAGHLSR
jgi:hypothetical protein